MRTRMDFFVKETKKYFFQPSLVIRQLKKTVYENGYKVFKYVSINRDSVECSSCEVFFFCIISRWRLRVFSSRFFVFKFIVYVLTTLYMYYIPLSINSRKRILLLLYGNKYCS